jgi:hypothetical protein
MRFVRFAAVILFSLSIAAIASAQATRTWVSGVGDDVNPCSRTAPCKTFAGAISKTASGGEIDALDPAGYGAVTVTKPITLDGNGWGSILVAGTNGVVINATGVANGTVVIKNLSINGAGAGISGIQVTAAGSTQGHVILDGDVIFGFTSRAVNATGSIPVDIDIRNCHFWNNLATAVAINPAASTAIKMTIDSSDISQNGVSVGTAGGIFAANGGKIVAHNSNISFNTAPGAEAGTGGEVFLDNCTMAGNQFGAKTSGGTLWLSRSVIYGSTGGAAVSNVSGVLLSFADNKMASNGTNNTGSAPSPGNQ